jgi:5-methylcytosine-specific restriction enzyme A
MRPTTRPSTSKRRHDAFAWEVRAREFLEANPWCAGCVAANRGKRPATIADHILPLRAGGDLMTGALQPLCQHCHQSVKRKLEAMYRRGEIGVADLDIRSKAARSLDRYMCRRDGMPTDPDHPWFRG